MFSPLTNNFLINPVPVQLTMNLCSHMCTYCFSILNDPKRKADLKRILSQLKNHKTRGDITSYFLREKYPVLISNNVDPFSNNNTELTRQITEILTEYDIPVQFNTRGGKDWREVEELIKPSLFYVSANFSNDETRKKYEPSAPSLDERFEMVQYLISRGHKIIIGLNPFDAVFCEDHTAIIDRYAEIGVKYFWVNKFHLSHKQQRNLTERQKSLFTEEQLKAAAKDAYSDEWIRNYLFVREYAASIGVSIIGTPSGHYEPYFEDVYSVYPKLLPTQNDFFKWCEENKQEGDFITFQEFYDFFAPILPEMETDISKYIYNKALLDDRTFMRKTKLSNILHVYWDSKAGLQMAKNYPVFSFVKKQFPTKLDWIKDENGDRVMLYHPETYNTKEFTILKATQ